MKRRQHFQQRQLFRKQRDRLAHLMRPSAERAGSTIVVVIVLMMGLLFLGMLLFTDAAQEKVNSEYFADAAKADSADLDPEPIFQSALRQIVLGANDREFQSPFYGGRNSLLPRMFGRDMAPFSGEGLNVIRFNETLAGNDLNNNGILETGAILVDQDRNGVPDANQTFAELVSSPAAVGTDRGVIGPTGYSSMSHPDVNYVYSDHTSTFLSWVGRIRNGAGGTLTAELPSYHRPQWLRSIIRNPDSSTQANPNNVYTNPATKRLMFFAHAEHFAILKNGAVARTSGGAPIRRFVSQVHPDTAPGTPLSTFQFTGYREGKYIGAGAPALALAADPAGVGRLNAGYIDIHQPIYTTPDGSRQFVPLISVVIRDMGALPNLNAVGNIAALRNPDGTSFRPPGPPSLNALISRSQHGTSRSEINGQYVLRANIAAAAPGDFDQHRWNFLRVPATNTDLANMEWWWLLNGRGEYQSPGGFANLVGLVPGVFGEEQRVRQMLSGSPPAGMSWPGPGTTRVDDNGNRVAGGAFTGGGIVFPNTVVFPAFSHPYDYYGRGSRLASGSATRRNLKTIGRNRFPAYDFYQGNQPAYPGSVLAGTLRTNWQNSQLRDERAETRLQANLASAQTDDSILSPGNTAVAHMSAGDRAATGRLSDRILQLMPYTLVDSPTAAETGRKITTQSWDLKVHSRPFYSLTSNPALRSWEFTSSTNANGGRFQFPPPHVGPNDPLRPEVRRLLRIWALDTATKRLQRRMSINGLTEFNANGRIRIRPLTPHVFGINSATSLPKLGRSPVSGPNSILGGGRFGIRRPEQIGVGATTYQRQEWLARYDRQRMCRDIFVMLYMFGGGNNVNYATQPNNSFGVYSKEQLREMAQFAVNWVDALDPDDTITKFEYDKNLSNGWNLDDDPFTDSADGFPRLSPTSTGYDPEHPEDNDHDGVSVRAGRGVVFGVEAQKLCLSEAVALFTKKITDSDMMPNNDDHPATQYDDRKHRRFMFVELDNVSTQRVAFTNDAWQIVIKKGDPAKNHVEERRLTLRDSPGISIPAPNSSGLVSRYNIITGGDVENRDASSGTRDGAVLPSFLMTNLSGTNLDGMGVPKPLQNHTYNDKIAPNGTTHLDLLTVAPSNPNSRYLVNRASTSSIFGDGPEIPHNTSTTPATPPGTDLLHLNSQDSINSSTGDRVLVQLRRRLHLDRQAPRRFQQASDQAGHNEESQDNQWVVVDEFLVPLSVFTLKDTDNVATVQEQLRINVRSTERRQPLARTARQHPNALITSGGKVDPTDPATYRLNTLGAANEYSGSIASPFPLYQPHSDRDFTSAAELFSLPLYGPRDATWLLGSSYVGSTRAALPAFANPAHRTKAHYESTAGYRFLRPDQPTVGVNKRNRWYRILELFEVTEPNPKNAAGVPWFVTHVGTNNELGYYRSAGKLNLNTLRHPGALAGLLDDPAGPTRPGITFNPNGPNFLTGHGREWWHEFLRARDGLDFITGLTLPGVPGTSRPFRDLSSTFNINPNNILEDTVFRSLVSDSGSILTKRRLFEAGTSTQHTSRTTDTSIDHTTRYRLLSKVMNNSTNRSNVFVIFLQVDFFEAKEVTAFGGEKVVRIGSKLATSPGYRQVYVVDRSRAMDIVKPSDLPRVNAGRFTYSLNENLDFSPLILHKQRIR